MAKILAPNKQHDGVSAGVAFNEGIGETSDPYLIEWFKTKGYKVKEPKRKTAAKKQTSGTVEE